MIRVGLGQDSHRFVAEGSGKPLILGGIAFPSEPGLEANSDGDVVLHALFNALSQAVGGRSLGVYADPLCRQGITDSAAYLAIALDMVRRSGYRIGNIGVSIEGQRPRIEPRAAEMRAAIARLAGVAENAVGVTATSGEGLTAFGRGEGLQALVIVSLQRVAPVIQPL